MSEVLEQARIAESIALDENNLSQRAGKTYLVSHAAYIEPTERAIHSRWDAC